jgi:TolB-like protein
MLRRGVVAFLLAGCLALALPLAAGRRAALAAPDAGRAVRTTTLAVLYFDYSGHDAALEALRKGMAQMLISDLSAVDTLQVVERDRLQALLDEQKLAKSGKIDASTAARIGKLLGARYLVLGSYFDALGAFRVDARLVDVETGQILKSVGANGKADDFLGLEQTLAEGLKQAALDVSSASVARGAGTAAPAASGRRPRPAAPKRLKTETALVYSRALVALDDGDRKSAQNLFRRVLTAQPDFELAARDLNKLIQ